jgi:hypothetical protein
MRWAFWRYTFTDSGYITRLHVLKTPWFAICLHWLNTPDPEPYDHDHPVSFLSLILRGWYREQRSGYWGKTGIVKHRWFNFIDATEGFAHSIVEVAPKTLTLCFMGPKTREWGYHLPGGWMYWKTYNDLKRQGIQP